MNPTDISMNDGVDPELLGTPRDYSEQLYRFYLEIPDHGGTVEAVLIEFLGDVHARYLHRLTHGFELDMPIQRVPDLVRELIRHNFAIYQIVRYAKIDRPYR